MLSYPEVIKRFEYTTLYLNSHVLFQIANIKKFMQSIFSWMFSRWLETKLKTTGTSGDKDWPDLVQILYTKGDQNHGLLLMS